MKLLNVLIKKIDDNKAVLLDYLPNRYYGVKFDDFNIKQLMLHQTRLLW